MSDGPNPPSDVTPPGTPPGPPVGGVPGSAPPPPAQPAPPAAPAPPAFGGGNAPPPPSQPAPPAGSPFGSAPAVQPQAGSRTATLGVRFIAKFLDGVIIGIPLAIVFAIFGINSVAWIAGLIQAVIFVGYLTYMESSTGATIGKKLLKLSVVDEAGNVPSQEAAFKRNAYGLIQLIPTFLGALASLGAVIGIAVTIATDEHNRGFHDKFAGTGVMRA